jgi:ABC-type Fe3+-hydroxamate transport system substrate-binding protein
MAAGRDTFINDMLQRSGFENVISTPASRYPEIGDDKIRKMKPNYIFLSSEPYPFKEEHLSELQTLSPSSRILLVDGEMFSWYGSRLLKSASYFIELFNSLYSSFFYFFVPDSCSKTKKHLLGWHLPQYPYFGELLILLSE